MEALLQVGLSPTVQGSAPTDVRTNLCNTISRERIERLVERLSNERRLFRHRQMSSLELWRSPPPPVSAYETYSKKNFSSLSSSPIFYSGSSHTWTMPEHCVLDIPTNTLIVSQLSSVVFLDTSSMHVIHKIGSGSTYCHGLAIDLRNRRLFVAPDEVAARPLPRTSASTRWMDFPSLVDLPLSNRTVSSATNSLAWVCLKKGALSAIHFCLLGI